MPDVRRLRLTPSAGAAEAGRRRVGRTAYATLGLRRSEAGTSWSVADQSRLRSEVRDPVGLPPRQCGKPQGQQPRDGDERR